MAFVDGEWLEVWARGTVIELRQKSIMFQLLSQEFTEPWVAGASAIHVPNPTYTNAVAAARARGGAWKTAEDLGQANVEFGRIGGANAANEVLAEDAMTIPWPLIDGLRGRQAYELSLYANDELYKWIKGANGLAATQDVTYGAAGNQFIARAAPYDAGGNNAANIALARALVYNAIEGFSLKLQRANAIDGAGDPVGQRWIIMPPELFVSLRKYMLSQDLHWDLLTESLLINASLLGEGAEYRGRLLGIDIYSWNGIAVPTGNANWEMLAGVRAAAYAATRPVTNQFFEPEVNQVSTKPAYLSRMAMEFGAAIGEASVFSEITIHAD